MAGTLCLQRISIKDKTMRPTVNIVIKTARHAGIFGIARMGRASEAEKR